MDTSERDEARQRAMEYTQYMTKQERAEIRARVDNATKGPWTYEPGGGHAYNRIVGSDSVQICGRPEDDPNGRGTRSYSDRVCENLGDPGLPGPAANIALIISARTDIPRLLDTVDALEAERDVKDARIAALETELAACKSRPLTPLGFSRENPLHKPDIQRMLMDQHDDAVRRACEDMQEENPLY